MPPRNKRRGARSSAPSTQRPQRDQYHHAIPRFILRRYQAGPRKSNAERQAEYRRSGVDPDQVLYYDVASGSLDERSVGKIYGKKNLYRDASNLSNVNEVEEKLALLERETALIVATLHSELPRKKVTLKRRDLDILRKFMFVSHYRLAGSTYFDPDLNPSLRQWLIRYQAEHQCQTHVDVWLRIMHYYLDTPHSQIVDDAHAEFKKYGYAEAFQQVVTGVDPASEHPESLAYQLQAESFFLGIWEAEATSEFILTNNAFGLWEGLTPSVDAIHRIFLVSPRIALVLRSNALPLFDDEAPKKSALLSIPQKKPTSRLVNGQAGIDLSNINDISEANRHRSPHDVFTFTITKLTLDQTDAFNVVLLDNVRSDGAITFLGRERMLRTLRVFWHNALHKFDRQKYASLMRHLSIIPPSLYPSTATLEPVDTELYVALMDIVLNQTKFVSGYDRALSIYRLLQKTSRRRTCSFVTQHIYNLTIFMEGCHSHFSMLGGPKFRNTESSLRLKTSLSPEVSARILTTLEIFVSKTLGLSMDFDEDVLGKLGKEIALLAFLDWLDVEMPMVLFRGMSAMDIITVKDAFYFV
ncbi:hypothetical protein IW262DRAFT_1461581 [Armillaria fumosa]|nr:hypothetical protein IW262DRAFT_1461581 [Armillaria fumosa]